MASRSLSLTDPLYDYLLQVSLREPALLARLREETAALPDARMQIAPEQGAFMTLLARAMGARRAIEIGTFTGYSALCLARGLSDDGELICCDVSEEWTAIGRRYWEKAGVSHKIRLQIAPAEQTIASLPERETFDLAFIDADKTGYQGYYEALLERLRPGGLIVVDNVLWGGSVVDLEKNDESTKAIRAFNDAVAGDERVDRVMISVSDGLTLVRKR